MLPDFLCLIYAEQEHKSSSLDPYLANSEFIMIWNRNVITAMLGAFTHTRYISSKMTVFYRGVARNETIEQQAVISD